MAYSLPAARLVNVPDWTARERFDITAVAEGASPGTRVDFEVVRLMLRTLLAERFGLVVHEETRDVEASVLLLDREDGRLGPGLRPAEPCEAPAASEVVGSGSMRCGVFSGPLTKMAGRAVTITTVARFVESLLDTPVVERTGLTGEFDLTLSFERDLNAQNSPLPAIFSALPEQLGLRLHSERVPMEVIVVDRINRPTPD